MGDLTNSSKKVVPWRCLVAGGGPMIARRRRTASGSEQEYSSVVVPSTTSRSAGTHYSPQPAFAVNAGDAMTSRDRTSEFKSAAKLLQGRPGNGYLQRKQGHSERAVQEWAEFMHVARQIGKDIANTFSKLEKLTLLAKRKTIFDDRPIEIQELTYIIKQDIGSLNKQIAQLQDAARSSKNRGTKHMQSHSNSVVVSLQSKLASMSNDFKSVLEVRTENLKHQKNRREQFSQSGHVSTAMPPSALSGHAGSVLLADEYARSTGGSAGDYSINMEGGGARQRQLQSQQQMLLLDEQESYIQSRADTMQNIESTIVELGSIFQQLAHMVKEQEEMVQRIDANVEDTSLNVEAAHSEILKYFQSVTSNRWLMIKVFAVLIVFFIIFVVFVA
ncbi:syntaxin-5 [Ixodes scapularis]